MNVKSESDLNFVLSHMWTVVFLHMLVLHSSAPDITQWRKACASVHIIFVSISKCISPNWKLSHMQRGFFLRCQRFWAVRGQQAPPKYLTESAPAGSVWCGACSATSDFKWFSFQHFKCICSSCKKIFIFVQIWARFGAALARHPLIFRILNVFVQVLKRYLIKLSL